MEILHINLIYTDRTTTSMLTNGLVDPYIDVNKWVSSLSNYTDRTPTSMLTNGLEDTYLDYVKLYRQDPYINVYKWGPYIDVDKWGPYIDVDKWGPYIDVDKGVTYLYRQDTYIDPTYTDRTPTLMLTNG
ncbi:hypothetical protein DPMN_178296 [Dreissena polymorpha]|uniref:Uncharacterized protein n=1 Tax=Dreissena polymorpha TaxID=45954 RepID=A0A9D4EAM1_DREPO|nr:hypothetical protein DPMN_178296 [Dreissena polymorpha]